MKYYFSCTNHNYNKTVDTHSVSSFLNIFTIIVCISFLMPQTSKRANSHLPSRISTLQSTPVSDKCYLYVEITMCSKHLHSMSWVGLSVVSSNRTRHQQQWQQIRCCAHSLRFVLHLDNDTFRNKNHRHTFLDKDLSLFLLARQISPCFPLLIIIISSAAAHSMTPSKLQPSVFIIYIATTWVIHLLFCSLQQ